MSTQTDGGKTKAWSAGFRLVIASSLIALLVGLASVQWRWLRAQAEANTCKWSLGSIDEAKKQWALENDKKEGDEVHESDIRSYFKGGVLPSCEAGGKYTIGVVGKPPKCNLPGHALDPPNKPQPALIEVNKHARVPHNR